MTKQEIIDYMYKNHVQGDFKIEEMTEDFAQPDLQPTCNQLATDTISRQDAIDALCNDYCGGHQDCKYYPNCENLKSIEQLPSAQPEIIRCKDCKHYDGRPCGIVGWYNTANDFCSRAERKGDSDE